jgi:hypothetical protein
MQGMQSPAPGGFTIWQWQAVTPSKIAQRTARGRAVSQLVYIEPGFPVEVGGAAELYAAFREESRT